MVASQSTRRHMSDIVRFRIKNKNIFGLLQVEPLNNYDTGRNS